MVKFLVCQECKTPTTVSPVNARGRCQPCAMERMMVVVEINAALRGRSLAELRSILVGIVGPDVVTPPGALRRWPLRRRSPV